MKRRATGESGFALVVTLVLMALVVAIVVAYLGNTRTDRSSSSLYANRLRAKMMADTGLTAAIQLLYDNTRHGNYITAMPVPAAGSTAVKAELYRPSTADDFLRLDNAIGEVLASRSAATGSTVPSEQIDPRPAATVLSPPNAGQSFGLTDATVTAADSFDFNQVVRVGASDTGRLVSASTPTRSAFGQWMRMRNTAGELVGRYAFFIEDESMKLNVDMVGNNLASGGNARTSDTILPAPAPAAPSQIQEIDPSAVLPAAANRRDAINSLASVGPAGARLPSMPTLALLANWDANFPDVAHMFTTVSRSDQTTARGWQRLELNAIVAEASDNAGKAAAARRISDWIRDAWTGHTALADLQDYQIFGDERLRLQFAANIVDYIDTDDVPTDVGDETPPTYTDPIPVIGVERIPYLGMVAVIYQASGRVANTTDLQVKFRFTFTNLYDAALDLQQFVSRIDVKGIPVVLKNGTVVLDKELQNFTVPVASLSPVTGSGYEVPPGSDGPVGSGARTFETGWLVNEKVTFPTTPGRPNFESGEVTVQLFGAGGNARVDVIAAPTSDTPATHYGRTANNSPTGDFLLDSDTTARSVAAIYLLEKVTGSLTQDFGDPRYRPPLLNERWRRLNLTDNQALADRLDSVDSNPRVYAVDWYDYAGNRPLAFLRNGPMLSIGELGNVATGEYPWRTLYLQYPERSSTAGNATAAQEVNTRRSNSVDFVVLDLFRVGALTRDGAFNINSQLQFTGAQNAIAPLFFGVPVGAQTLAETHTDRLTFASGSATTSPVLDRRIAAGPPTDNPARRPFFHRGELASVVSRLINTSAGGTGTTGSPGRTTVNYSALRTTPTRATEANANLQTDMQVEQAFRKVSSAITTRGNVFRVLYVGQAIRDIARSGVRNGVVDGTEEIAAEYLGEALVERVPVTSTDSSNPNIVRTSDSAFRILSNRVITQ